MTLPESSQLTRPDGTVLRYCEYGQADGYPVVFHSGSPSTRWKWPTLIEAMRRSELRVLAYDRPGYGGSTRSPGRTVADAANDVRALADAHGWNQFAVFGGSGGGPHALACAALLTDRVTACAVLSGVKPADPDTPPREEAELRSRLAEVSADIMGRVNDGGPELPGTPGPPALDDPDAMARLRATFVDGTDGWVDDSLALARPWGFELETITVPVGVWRGTDDAHVSAEHSDHLLAHIATARGHVYSGGHIPGVDVYQEIYDWLHPDAA
ncbi:alpha/beta hydrolase [Longispora fulva]|uniref:Pimeloyl-ACP methyl ester carboxylesterase n=1 Tax=Longispora fulva TaxID=619741 RepID=A0A8J7G6J5_9ACTN|nr:alpha/beta hydrolase [Longispora fulva]MBG6134613.1 pimeloyl-ACP methyl ester carboxylesterase [Longispora fulva]GIG61820.1 alpha/beta hydrolase [Longispora fulva]